MNLGRLNQRITIEQRTAGQDAAGQPAGTWQAVATVWADVRHLSGLETIKAGAESSAVKASIRIRNRSGLNAGMRVVHGGSIYNIKAVPPYVASRPFLDLVCEVAQ